MIHNCMFCKREIEDGEIISIVIVSPYKKLGSKVAFALNTVEMVAMPDTIAHEDCDADPE